jgi:hypothetical protein
MFNRPQVRQADSGTQARKQPSRTLISNCARHVGSPQTPADCIAATDGGCHFAHCIQFSLRPLARTCFPRSAEAPATAQTLAGFLLDTPEKGIDACGVPFDDS